MIEINAVHDNIMVNGEVSKNRESEDSSHIMYVRHPQCEVTLIALADSKVFSTCCDASHFCQDLRNNFMKIRMHEFELVNDLNSNEYSQEMLLKIGKELLFHVDKRRVMFSVIITDGVSVCVISKGNIKCYTDKSGILSEEKLSLQTAVNPLGFSVFPYENVNSMFLVNSGVYKIIGEETLNEIMTEERADALPQILTSAAFNTSGMPVMEPAVIGLIKQPTKRMVR